jgi:uncharacterized protein (UPF0332 family)
MYNGATPVLLALQGTIPKTHSSIVGQFGLLVRGMPGRARDHGRALREGFELRLLIDYDAGATGLAERAQASLDAASSFVAFATSLIRRR